MEYPKSQKYNTPELLLSWTPEQLAYLRDIAYWAEIVNSSRDAEVISISLYSTVRLLMVS